MNDKDYLDEINRDMDKRELILTAVLCGSVIGFIIGIVVASLLHKYIVHPLGW